MNRRFHLMALSWASALVGFTFLIVASTPNTPVQATMADSSVSVSITESGFDPAVVTITVGTTVAWTNRTQETVHLVSGQPYRIYLPLVVRNLGGAGATATSSTATSLVQLQNGWGNVDIAPGESYTHTFTMAGDYAYFLTGHPNQTGLVVVQGTLVLPDFTLAVTPSSRTATQGQSVAYTVTLTAAGGFTAPVTLSASGLPAGTAVAWSANPITPTDRVVLTVTTTTSTPSGDHLFSVTGTGGGQSHDAQATLSVEALTSPDFELDAWPATQTITRGHSVGYTVAVTAVHGFTKAVALDVDGYPSGAAFDWTTNPVTPTADTTFTITPSVSGPTGTFTLIITGTGGGQVHSLPITLTVTSVPCPQTGLWVGITNEGYPITYTVSHTGGCQVDSGLVIKYSTNCWIATSTLNWDMPIENNHFDSGGNIPRVIGDFTSQTIAIGTWSYAGPWPFPPYWCSGSGTWTANYSP